MGRTRDLLLARALEQMGAATSVTSAALRGWLAAWELQYSRYVLLLVAETAFDQWCAAGRCDPALGRRVAQHITEMLPHAHQTDCSSGAGEDYEEFSEEVVHQGCAALDCWALLTWLLLMEQAWRLSHAAVPPTHHCPMPITALQTALLLRRCGDQPRPRRQQAPHVRAETQGQARGRRTGAVFSAGAGRPGAFCTQGTSLCSLCAHGWHDSCWWVLWRRRLRELCWQGGFMLGRKAAHGAYRGVPACSVQSLHAFTPPGFPISPSASRHFAKTLLPSTGSPGLQASPACSWRLWWRCTEMTCRSTCATCCTSLVPLGGWRLPLTRSWSGWSGWQRAGEGQSARCRALASPLGHLLPLMSLEMTPPYPYSLVRSGIFARDAVAVLARNGFPMHWDTFRARVRDRQAGNPRGLVCQTGRLPLPDAALLLACSGGSVHACHSRSLPSHTPLPCSPPLARRTPHVARLHAGRVPGPRSAASGRRVAR